MSKCLAAHYNVLLAELKISATESYGSRRLRRSMHAGRLAEAFAKNSKPKGFEDIVPTSLHIYADVFSKTAFDTLPERRKWDHAIELEREPSPGFRKVYPMTLTEQTEMDAFLEQALATGCIRQSKSPLGAPVFFIKKKDGKLRFVQDYRALNAITRKNRYPLPLIDDLIHRLKDVHYFIKLDIRWGYNNVHIREGDEWKAAFHTNRGLFEPLVMYFGLTNSCKGTSVHILTSSPLLPLINSHSTLCICTSTPTPVPIPRLTTFISNSQ
jgi:hypothetical protein